MTVRRVRQQQAREGRGWHGGWAAMLGMKGHGLGGQGTSQGGALGDVVLLLVSGR